MEKILNLLNDYAPDYCKNYPDDIIMDEIIISKRFGFIKRLVENDKIDYHNKINYDISLAINRVIKKTTREERLLMILAIQDEPIKFLLSILK